METIEQRVMKIVSQQLGISLNSFTTASTFVADLGCDSLDEIELVMALEDGFALEIPDDEAEAVKTPADAIAWITKELAKQAA